MQNLKSLSGIFIFISFIITVYSYFISNEFFIYSGIFTWIAFLILFKSCSNIKFLVSLLFLSFLIFFYSYSQDFLIEYKHSILVNQYLLTLLIAVSFLRLIVIPKKEKNEALPLGKQAFLKTYLGVHLFGSVINLSSPVLVADRLYKESKLTKLQIILLTRAFSSDAYWSPFFVAFAVALTYAPNLSTSVILSTGIVLAFIAFFITYLDVSNQENFDLKEFRGYPIHFETLYLPFMLALMVLFTSYYYPEVKVILLISLYSILLTFFILAVKVGLFKTVKKINTHIIEELPKMKNELALFLVAGIFGVSISSLLVGFNISFPFEEFNGFSASILLLVFIVLSFVGIHPIVSIAIIGNWSAELNHTLLAVAFLMSWSIAVSTSPFSGLNLTIQARYDLKAMDIFKTNIFYAIKMYFICVIILFLLANYLDLK